MSEERFNRIEGTLAVLKTDVQELKTDVQELKTDVQELKTDVQELKTDVQELKTDVQELKTDVKELKTDVLGLKTEMVDLRGEVRQVRHEMLVLHEHTIDTIKALAPDFAPIRREFTAADAELREDIDRRLVPLETAVRERFRKGR